MNILTKKTINILLVACISLSLPLLATAEEFNLHVADIDTECGNFGIDASLLGNADIKINYLDLTFDDSTNLLSVEVEADNSRGKISDSFHLVLSDGPMPKGIGHVSHIYFDAQDINDPKVNVYTYNGKGATSCDGCEIDTCGNSMGSWENANCDESFNPGADKIVSSTNNEYFSEDVGEASAIKTVDGQITTKTFRLVLDVTNINKHIPIMQLFAQPPYGYDGISFSDLIGVWFWAGADTEIDYKSNGFLRDYFIPKKGTIWGSSEFLGDGTNINIGYCAVCDQTFETKRKPACNGSSATKSPVSVGENTTLIINVKDYDINDANVAPVNVVYTGIPSGAKPSTTNGGEIFFDENGNGSLLINWTPTAGQEGSYKIDAIFSKEYGLGQLASDNCPVEIEVIAPKAECKVADINLITQADQDLGHLAGLSKRLKTKTTRIYKNLGINRAVDNFDSDAEHTKGWVAFYEIASKGNYLYECTNVESCTNGGGITSLSGSLTNFNTALANLTANAQTRLKKFKRAKIKYFINVKGFSKAKARSRATKITNRLFAEGKNGDGINPTSKSAQSQVDAHIENYGTERYTCSNFS